MKRLQNVLIFLPISNSLNKGIMALQAMGKTNIRELRREDLVCIDREIASALKIGYAGDPFSNGVKASMAAK